MPRITVELTSEDHRALKLFSIVEGKTLGGVLREAIQGHLQHKGAHNLEVTVQNEEERNAIYMALKAHPQVKLVL